MKTILRPIQILCGLVVAGQALAVCDVSLHSVLSNGQIVLKANCGGDTINDINWLRNNTSITNGTLPIAPAVSNDDIFYTTMVVSGKQSYTATGNEGGVAAGKAATIISPDKHALTVAAGSGGEVDSAPAGIVDCTNSAGTCIYQFDANVPVSLTATAASGYVFANWSGDCSGTTPTCALVMNASRVVSANFGSVPVNGACGSDSNTTPVTTEPTDPGLCSAGTPSGVSNPVAAPWNYTWNCAGVNGGQPSSTCSAPKQIAGTCGSLHNGSPQSSTPSNPATLCGTGTPGAVSSRTSPYEYYWTCTGINNGANSSECKVAQTSANGQCGSAHNGNVSSAPTGAAACTVGTVSGMNSPSPGGNYNWTCTGTGGGTSSGACTAHQTVNGACGSANGQSYASLTSGSANLCVAGSAVNGFAGSGPWTWGCNGVNGGNNTTSTTSCSASKQVAQGDPGRGTGTWTPPGSSNIWVMDQMGTPNGTGTVSYVPGCLNNTATPAGSSQGCAALSSFAGANTITLAQNNTISIRFTSTANAPTGKSIRLANSSGSNFTQTMMLWISPVPPGVSGGDYANVPEGCKVTQAGGMAIVYTHSTYCAISRNTAYYVNIRSSTPCSGATCRFQLIEGSSSDLF
jgi:hypothetical protein